MFDIFSRSGKKKAIVMFGGSFSPIQRSHVAAAALSKEAVEAADASVEVTSVMLSPVGDAYGKKGLWPKKDRLLCAYSLLAEEKKPCIDIEAWEALQSEYQQTYQVAQHFKTAYKDTGKADLVLMLGGADLFEGMFTCKPTPKIPKVWDAESVAGLFKQLDGFVIIQRAGSVVWKADDVRTNLKQKLEGLLEPKVVDDCVIVIAEGSAGDGSSTQVRELIGGGLETEEDKQALTKLVGVRVTDQIYSEIEHYKNLVGGIEPTPKSQPLEKIPNGGASPASPFLSLKMCNWCSNA
eukprot:TRINITY_DN41245_c0_g1_i1.p1 TRINITY_DN41245_c0_g1~~TRINITY_DN41245_c0_g1_i1.p1  ORF type:complete len:309 (+),score=68.43 TRINITY_DN41245_c0_g1_i1:48-929(+)